MKRIVAVWILGLAGCIIPDEPAHMNTLYEACVEKCRDDHPSGTTNMGDLGNAPTGRWCRSGCRKKFGEMSP